MNKKFIILSIVSTSVLGLVITYIYAFSIISFDSEKDTLETVYIDNITSTGNNLGSESLVEELKEIISPTIKQDEIVNGRKLDEKPNFSTSTRNCYFDGEFLGKGIYLGDKYIDTIFSPNKKIKILCDFNNHSNWTVKNIEANIQIIDDKDNILEEVEFEKLSVIPDERYVEVKMDYMIPSEEGIYKVSFKIDPENKIQEMDENDNENIEYFQVMEGYPDLNFTGDITMEGASTYDDGSERINKEILFDSEVKDNIEKLLISFAVSNNTNIPINNSIKVMIEQYINGRLFNTSIAEDGGSIGNEGNTIFTFDQNNSQLYERQFSTELKSGKYEFVLTIDPEDEIKEIDETNNSYIFSFSLETGNIY